MRKSTKRDNLLFIERVFAKSKVFCGDCNSKMFLEFDHTIRKKVYRCMFYPKCKGMALATKYKVTPGNKVTREARYVAHKELEAFFKNKLDSHRFVRTYGSKKHLGHMNVGEIQKLMEKFYIFKKDEIRVYIWNELKSYL